MASEGKWSVDPRRRAARRWVAVAIGFLLLAMIAYDGDVRGWMPGFVALPLVLLGVVGFAAATVRSTFVRRSVRR